MLMGVGGRDWQRRACCFTGRVEGQIGTLEGAGFLLTAVQVMLKLPPLKFSQKMFSITFAIAFFCT